MSRLPVVLVALLSLACAWPVGAQSNGTVDTVCDQNRDAQGGYRCDADVTVVGRATFSNLADLPNPAENVLGVAQSASQGAITARQLETRPIMRTGEVLETVPGVVISQHSGEGKANQYYLRGFNLDHGTDFSTTVAGLPVNMPTHGHGQGYSDLNFLIPELVSGVQYSKGTSSTRATATSTISTGHGSPASRWPASTTSTRTRRCRARRASA